MTAMTTKFIEFMYWAQQTYVEIYVSDYKSFTFFTKAFITLCVFGLRFGRTRKGFCVGKSLIICLSNMMMEY